MTLTSRDGTLWITFYHQSKRYRRSLKLDDTKKNRKFAQNNIIPEIMYKLNSGEFFNNEKKNKIPTVDEFIYKSFDIHKNRRNTPTHNDYIGCYKNHIKDMFGRKRLDQIKPSDIELWQNHLLDKGIGARRVRTIRTVLTTMYSDAIKDEIIATSPLSMVKVPKAGKVEIHPFSIDEVKLIIDTAKGQFKNFYATAFFTGMRSGELIGLKWQDIDFNNMEISVQRAIKMGTISTPKTDNSIRVIDLLDYLLPYLKDQYRLTGKKNSYVFLNDEESHFYDIKRIRNTHWKRVLKECELKYRPIYHTRHTFATIMLENNEDILWVSNMLGHTDSTMTLSKYARYIKRSKTKRAQFLNDL